MTIGRLLSGLEGLLMMKNFAPEANGGMRSDIQSKALGRERNSKMLLRSLYRTVMSESCNMQGDGDCRDCEV